MTEPKDGYQVVFNGEDYQVQRYRGQVVTYRETREEAEEYCRLLNATRRQAVRPKNVVDWLKSLEYPDATPVSATIKGTTYHGARYTQNGSERMYLIGTVPACYRHSRRTCFLLDGDPRDWYVATYSTGDIVANPKFAQYHPFGQSFMIMPWTLPEVIDHHDVLSGRKPYARVSVQVKE